MIALRAAALVAAMVTVTLNAAYGFKTSTAVEYAILFASLNAALDVAKCACLVGASRAWQTGQRNVAVVLFILFWPLLVNSLWCGLSEVAFNRSSEQRHFEVDAELRALAQSAHAAAAADLAALKASPLYNSSTACALPKTSRERALCAKYDRLAASAREAVTAIGQTPVNDPAPQVTMLASWTGYDIAALLLATALWPIVLAELTSSIGFYVSAQSPGRAERRHKRFWHSKAVAPSPIPKTDSNLLSGSPTPKIHWGKGAISS